MRGAAALHAIHAGHQQILYAGFIESENHILWHAIDYDCCETMGARDSHCDHNTAERVVGLVVQSQYRRAGGSFQIPGSGFSLWIAIARFIRRFVPCWNEPI